MFPRIILPDLILSPRKMVPIMLMLSFLVSSCSTAISNYLVVDKIETPQNAVSEVFTPAPQELESSAPPNSVNDAAQWYSSDELGLCFSYPEGYSITPSGDTFSIYAPFLPGAGDTSGHFYLEISEAYDRSALRIADEEMTMAASLGVPRENLGWWALTLDGEESVVLDGLPGQNFTRKVYAVRGQSLYILAFSPTRYENKEVADQMETLYAAVTSSWLWSPCE